MNPPVTAQERHDAVGPAGEKAGTPATSETTGIATVPPTVPDYDLLRRIGHGAYGDVWLARNKATSVLRAAKIVWRRSFEDDRPFQREFEGIRRFESVSREHPSQLALFHIGRNEPEGYFYYVMELADDFSTSGSPSSPTRDKGKAINRPPSEDLAVETQTYKPHTLRADLEQGRLSPGRVLEIGLALTEALGHLHSKGLVHRDVKPSNVIFVNGRPKLADIGLVTDASDQCSIVGTEGYLPPDGSGTVQADIFALGKVLYEAATGLDRREFPKLPQGLRSWPDASLVFELNEIALRACAKEFDGRYEACQEIHDELALLQRGRSVKRRRTMERRLVLGKKAAFVVAALTVLGVGFAFLLPGLSPARRFPDGPPSTNAIANALCEKAMNILRYDAVAEFAEAYTNFFKAIDLDRNFARPYVGLLELRAREHIPSLPLATAQEMDGIAGNLERLAPGLAATHVARGIVNWSEGRYPEAESCILAAIKANPKYELAHTWYSWLLECYGRPKEGDRQLRIAQSLALSKVTIYRGFGNNYYVERDYTNAKAWYEKTLQWEPHHAVAWHGIGESMWEMGDYTNALVYYEKAEVLFGADEAEVKQRYASLRRALDEKGITGYYQLLWTWAEKNTNETLYSKAALQICLGNTNAALDLLQQSYETRERGDSYMTPVNMLLYDQCWYGVRNHPQFRKLLEQIGYTKVMAPESRP